MLSWLYGKIMDLRNALYEKGVFKSTALGAPAVSVGNLTVGGTGKTPLVAVVAEILAESGARVCILTRGYGRENPKRRVLVSDGRKILANARDSGDEPYELAVKLRGKAIVVADADRAAAAVWVRQKFGVTAFVLDDGFQHRQARRDLDIVAIDATAPFGNDKVLPFGTLREPLANLARADLIVVTRAGLVNAEKLAELKSEISNLNPECPVLTARNKVSALTEINDFHAGTPGTPNVSDSIPTGGARCLAFCALGNPDNFFEQLKREHFSLAATVKFPDHHRFTNRDVEGLVKKAAQAGAEILLTTAKDAVKLKDFDFRLPCFVVESEMIFDDKEKLRGAIRAVFLPPIQNPKSNIQYPNHSES